MDRLWAPWRINYIKNKGKKKCIFCQAVKKPAGNYVFFDTKTSLGLLNAYPYNNGHVMIAPKRHVADISRLKEDEAVDLFKCLKRVKMLLGRILKPQGYNIGINLGRVSGAGIPGHLHIHIVPRWAGDTNFMPIASNTKVICQSLSELRRQLKNAKPRTD